MTRRFQFSLKKLLGLTATVCLLLGVRHLLETCGSYIDIVNQEPVADGEPINVRGRIVRVFGPRKL